MNYPSDGSYTVLRRTILLIINQTNINDQMKVKVIKELLE